MRGIVLALIADISVVSICTFILLRHGRLAHSHPGAIYLFFHVYTFTLRLLGISLGADTLFTNWKGFFIPVTHGEIIRAVLLGDLALIVMVIAWMKASADSLRKERAVHQHSGGSWKSRARLAALIIILKKKFPELKFTELARIEKMYSSNLSLRHIWRVFAVVLPIGVFGLIALSRFPGVAGEVNFGTWQESSYISITQSWVGLALLALIYWYGFRWWLMLPMSFYLLIMSLQGAGRFRVVIPVVLLIQIYLDRRKLKWPPASTLVILLTLVFLFYPLKSIGILVNKGVPLSEIAESSLSITKEALTGQHSDQQFLDQYASALTLIDRKGNFYLGQTYLALFTLPVPRQLWPNKPGLVDYMKDFSTPSRPMFENGMIVTFLGESYANFGYVGLICVPFLIAYGLARAYFSAYRSGYYTVSRLFYLLIACNLIQVYRDGIISIVVFTLVNMFPLMLIVLLHYLFPLWKKSQRFSRFANASHGL